MRNSSSDSSTRRTLLPCTGVSVPSYRGNRDCFKSLFSSNGEFHSDFWPESVEILLMARILRIEDRVKLDGDDSCLLGLFSRCFLDLWIRVWIAVLSLSY